VKDSHAQSVFRILPRRPRRERAFSLHEALVALTVISTVSAAALPTSLHLISNQLTWNPGKRIQYETTVLPEDKPVTA
jgi:Tfp pilus assembly protein FimT